MAVYGVRIESAPPKALRDAGAIVGCFESREEAEYFMAIAWHLGSLNGCGLAVVVMPMLDRPRASGQAA